MIAVLQLAGVLVLIVALIAALEAWLGPPKKGAELMRSTGNPDPADRFNVAVQTAWNQAAQRRWRPRYEACSADERLGSSCGPARVKEDDHV